MIESSPSSRPQAVGALTADVVASFAATPDPRLRTILASLVRHLHAAAVEVDLTTAEWSAAVDFVTRLGQACTDVRQEVILFSDVLGLSMLQEILHEAPDEAGATEATVLGPFHMTQSPRRELGDTIDQIGVAAPFVVRGSVRTTTGEMVPGATLDVWQADDHGFYDVQVPDRQPAGNGRGVFTADERGRFWFRTVAPSFYPIPTDGPVGELLAATGRHPYRPAHIHFIASADGCTDLTTHIFLGDSPYLDSDAVFAVRDSLVVDKRPLPDAECEALDVPHGTLACEIDLVLHPDDSTINAPAAV